MMQLLRGLNKQLDKEPESRKRNFVYYTPIIVPIWPQVCTLLRIQSAICRRCPLYAHAMLIHRKVECLMVQHGIQTSLQCHFLGLAGQAHTRDGYARPRSSLRRQIGQVYELQRNVQLRD